MGALSSILGLIVIIQYIVRSHQPFSKLPLITPASEWPVFFASAMYVFEGIALVSSEGIDVDALVWETVLARSYPFNKKWRTLNRTEVGRECWILAFFWSLFSTFSSASSVIWDLDLTPRVPSLWISPTKTSNLNRLATSSHFDGVALCIRLYQWTKILYAVAIFLTYNLQFYVPFSLLWPRVCRKILYKYGEETISKCEHAFRIGLIFITCKWHRHSLDIWILLRKGRENLLNRRSMPSFCLISVMIAALIPNIGLVISLVGAVASTALSVIFPPICESITFWPDGLGRYKWQLVLNILIISFGVYVFIAGTTLSLSNIIACYREGHQCGNWSSMLH